MTETDARAPAGARDLERLACRVKALSSELLALDMYERWGGGSDPAMSERLAAGGSLLGDQLAARAALKSLLGRLRTEDPAAVAYWCDAHDKLLAQFLTTTQDETARFVAEGERKAWAALQAGGPEVDENTFYVHADRALHRALFGELEP